LILNGGFPARAISDEPSERASPATLAKRLRAASKAFLLPRTVVELTRLRGMRVLGEAGFPSLTGSGDSACFITADVLALALSPLPNNTRARGLLTSCGVRGLAVAGLPSDVLSVGLSIDEGLIFF
jgi:hypothetical protein